MKSLGCRFGVDLTSGSVYGGRGVGTVFVSCTVMAWYYQLVLEAFAQDKVLNVMGKPLTFVCDTRHRGWVR